VGSPKWTCFLGNCILTQPLGDVQPKTENSLRELGSHEAATQEQTRGIPEGVKRSSALAISTQVCQKINQF